MGLSKDCSVALVEVGATWGGEFNGEPASDVYSGFRPGSRALPTLEGVLRHKGFENVVQINPLFHGENGKFSDANFRYIENSDVVLLSSIIRTRENTLRLAGRVRAVNPQAIIGAGGPDPTLEPDAYLNDVNFVVVGEGESGLEKFLDNPFYEGIIEAPLMSVEELGNSPHPYIDEVTRKKARVASIETSRGCPKKCNFCGVWKVSRGIYRQKPHEYTIEELKSNQDVGRVNFFTDDNFPGHSQKNRERSLELAEKIEHEIKQGRLKKKPGIIQATIKLIEDDELLKAYQRIGIDTICFGIESFVDASLRGFRKGHSVQDNIDALIESKKRGIWSHVMMIQGADGDTFESLEYTSDILNKYASSVQVFPLIPIPGTDLRVEMENQGRILDVPFYLYDGHYVALRPKNFTAFELQESVNNIYRRFYTFDRRKKLVDEVRGQENAASKLVTYKNIVLGIESSLNSLQMQKHLEYLKGVG